MMTDEYEPQLQIDLPLPIVHRSSQPSQDSGPGRNVIWKINVYPEVKIFLWKICQNGLPTLDYIVGIIHS